MTTTLTQEWKTIASVEGGEVLACLDHAREGYLKVSFPEGLREDRLVELLRDKGVEVVVPGESDFYNGESPGEIVGFFRLDYSGTDL